MRETHLIVEQIWLLMLSLSLSSRDPATPLSLAPLLALLQLFQSVKWVEQVT